MSKHLQAFYVHYMNWLKLGCPDTPEFDQYSNSGLCWCLSLFIKKIPELDPYDQNEVSRELHHQFMDADLPINYPFGGYDVYRMDRNQNSMGENYKRIAWVKKHAQGENHE